ncbi:glycosyltransferase [Kytococcus sedentarius]|uniref:glycosyltransferase n=1 Tax=Kytococcus sedentarius TaxID=1276 RepID=UPI0035BBA128
MIGYYVHHVGAGHATRATAVARACAARGQEVVGLSSRPRPDDWPGEWVELPEDTTGIDHLADPAPHHDVTAGGVLHFAPLQAGFGPRQQAIAQWVAQRQPRVVAVDVSVEVTAMVRLLGVPVVTVAMPGDRSDAPHRLGYRMARRIVACWPEGAHPDHVVTGPDLAGRTTFVGGVSRFARGVGGGAPRPRDAALGVLLWGHGSDAPGPAELDGLRAADPGVHWELARDLPPRELWSLLTRAGVVVTHAGQGAVADVATAGAPAVVVAQPRPHDEQASTTRALDRCGVAATAHGWPGDEAWPELLATARRIGGGAWEGWLGTGAAGIAEVLRGV